MLLPCPLKGVTEVTVHRTRVSRTEDGTPGTSYIRRPGER